MVESLCGKARGTEEDVAEDESAHQNGETKRRLAKPIPGSDPIQTSTAH